MNPVGSKVKNLKVGDRVALEPGATCGEHSANSPIYDNEAL